LDIPFASLTLCTRNPKSCFQKLKMFVARVARPVMGQVRLIHAEARLAALGKKLPEPGTPKGSYVTCQWADDSTLHLAGHLPTNEKGDLIKGKVGKDVTVDQAKAAAESACLSLLATLKKELGDLDQVKQVVKVVGFVNCVDGFDQQPMVINGCSDLLGKVFVDGKGLHARSAVGTNALPLNVAVEIEMIVKTHGKSKSSK
jgi:enamine deaminase RidA (YjgF/YER057c/UK114 family)